VYQQLQAKGRKEAAQRYAPPNLAACPQCEGPPCCPFVQSTPGNRCSMRCAGCQDADALCNLQPQLPGQYLQAHTHNTNCATRCRQQTACPSASPVGNATATLLKVTSALDARISTCTTVAPSSALLDTQAWPHVSRRAFGHHHHLHVDSTVGPSAQQHVSPSTRFAEFSSKLERQKLMNAAPRSAFLHLVYRLSNYTPRQPHQAPPLLPTARVSQASAPTPFVDQTALAVPLAVPSLLAAVGFQGPSPTAPLTFALLQQA
jgi:hypothetical protein